MALAAFSTGDAVPREVFAIELIFVLELILNFFVATEKTGNKTEQNKRPKFTKVAKKYFFSWRFLFHLIPCLPLQAITLPRTASGHLFYLVKIIRLERGI